MQLKPEKGIAVLGFSDGNPGPSIVRAVDIATGEELFREDIGFTTSNVAEFLALVHATMYVRENQIKGNIYTHSSIAKHWYQSERVNSTETDERINQMLSDGIEYLSNRGGRYISFWTARYWGDNPASLKIKALKEKKITYQQFKDNLKYETFAANKKTS